MTTRSCPKCSLLMARCDFKYCPDCGAQLDSLCPSDATTCSVVAPNLVQAGDLWLMEDEDAYHPDKMEYSLLIQCSNAEQVREAMKMGKIEFTIFAHYPQNADGDGRREPAPPHQ